MFKIGSLFDGSGGFPLAASLCGGVPVWASEVEPYPIAVTRSRFPNMKHLGSVTEINGAKVDPVDVITFGSPCQDLSVAGKRAGLKHEDNGDEETTRSGLFMEAVRIIKEMREATNGVYPTFAIWENVPGAFSSNRGEDFRTVLEELIKIAEPEAVMPAVPQGGWAYADSYCGDGWSIAYRVFDAQYWGVPQRRRRIYLVADFRGQCAGKVLFERKGLRRDFETSRETREEAAGDAESGIGTADREGNGIINLNKGDVQSKAVLDPAGIAPSLYAGECRGGGGECYVVDKKRYGISSYHSYAMLSDNPNSGIYEATTSRTLDLNGGNPACNQGGIMVVEPVTYDGSTVTSPYNVQNPQPGDPCHTLGTDNRNYVVYALDQQGGKGGANYAENVMPTICSDSHGTPHAVVYGVDGYNSTLTGEKSATLGVNCGMSTGRNGVVVPYTLKIRSGCEGGGKGALIQEDKSATLATNNDQYLFQPVTLEPGIAAREGGHVYEGVSGTLRANMGDNQMAVAYSIENHPADSRVNIDETGKVQTLTSRMGTGGGNVPMVMIEVRSDD